MMYIKYDVDEKRSISIGRAESEYEVRKGVGRKIEREVGKKIENESRLGELDAIKFNEAC